MALLKYPQQYRRAPGHGYERTTRGRALVPGSSRWTSFWERHKPGRNERPPAYVRRRKGHSSIAATGLAWLGPDRWTEKNEAPDSAMIAIRGSDVTFLLNELQRSASGRRTRTGFILVRWLVYGQVSPILGKKGSDSEYSVVPESFGMTPATVRREIGSLDTAGVFERVAAMVRDPSALRLVVGATVTVLSESGL